MTHAKSTSHKKSLRIALVGNPNCGKTALFNALTGSSGRVANYSGVTVDKKHGFLTTPNGTHCTLIDLPGTYSLASHSPDEQITRDVIMHKTQYEEAIDLILCVIDATNLASGLRLILELKQTGTPLIIALNMADLAKQKGYHYDIAALSRLLECDIVATTAIKSGGIRELVGTIDKTSQNLASTKNTWQLPDIDTVRQYHHEVAKIIKQVEINAGTPSYFTDLLDRILLQPVLGLIFLFGLMLLIFQAVFSWATWPCSIMQRGVTLMQQEILYLLPHSLLGSLLANGIVTGVGAVLVFLPQILTISLFIVFLEDTGYMARVAFLMDKLMGGVGLHGKAFIPLISSFACAIPGIMATRTIENRYQRLITILISPLMTCSARLPVYTLLISALIPNRTVLGFMNLQGLVMFTLYLSGIVFAILVAWIIKIFFMKHSPRHQIIELPSYKIPAIRDLCLHLIHPAQAFIKRAGTIIVSILVILWFLSSFPLPPEHATLPALDYSFVAIWGKILQPLFAPLGFPWQVVAALIPGAAAREVLVSSLATIYALGGTSMAMYTNLGGIIHHTWTLATGLSLLTWYVFAPQCATTLAVVKRETNSWKWPLIMFSYQLLLAYSMAFVVYQIAH